ncbi:MAG TPA: T9SS type A sorting domain-containing protein, partial [Bacteroidia bacterium]|nr:T9SS type A sorting domain-containing protein [Bacteroidia bacterium]
SEISSYPNPFTETINVVFTNEKTQLVRFVVYDMSGREVKILLEDKVEEGKAHFGFSPGPLSSGVYLLRAEAKDGSVLFSQRIVRE